MHGSAACLGRAEQGGWQISHCSNHEGGQQWLAICWREKLPTWLHSGISSQGKHGSQKGKGIGSDCWECGCECPHKDYVTYPHPPTPHPPPLGIKPPSLVTDTELGMCLRLFLSKLSQLCSDKPGKTNCALLWEGKKCLNCSKSRRQSQLYLLIRSEGVGLVTLIPM